MVSSGHEHKEAELGNIMRSTSKGDVNFSTQSEAPELVVKHSASKDDEAPDVVINSTGPSPPSASLSVGSQDEEAGNFAAVDKKGRFAFLKTKQFYAVLFLGQLLSLCIVASNTFSTLLANKGTSIPAFQTFFNYAVLNVVFTGYTIHQYGFKNWGLMMWKDGWKYIILAFMDVEANYFTVLAYRYTTILSAELINFWAIVVVVIISVAFLKVRYHWAQILGILICCGGMGILLVSDNMNGSKLSGGVPDELKGDLFMLLGATFYGFSNVAEEFFVSKKPLYEVVGQLAFWGMLINGTQAGIFDRQSFRSATWDGEVAGYIVGFTFMMLIFYTLAPIIFRMASAAFMNISLLTGNFWGVLIGIKVFGYTIHFLYPIAFVLIVLGLFIYYMLNSSVGEASKPWLGENQEEGVDGIGTAKRKVVGKQRGQDDGAGV
ncbi:hypothetical protein RUND412_001641 [Rhizina undulata]